MGKMVTLSLKVSEETQKKLKVVSTLSGRSMTSIITDFVDKLDVNVPSYMSKKPSQSKQKPQKRGNKAIKKQGIYDPEKVKERVLALKDENLTYGKIAERLDAEGIATRQGGSWSRATVSNIYRRAIAPKNAEDAPE
jgi:hypothetical protein